MKRAGWRIRCAFVSMLALTLGACSSSSGGSAPAGGAGGAGGAAGTAGAAGNGGAIGSAENCAIDAPTHWQADVYVVKCKLDVASSLTIDPGAVVKLGPGAYVDVRPGATLSAIGTEAAPIVFTSLADDAHGGDSAGDGPSTPAKGDWGCSGECGALNLRGDGAVLDHVQVLYGSAGIRVQAASIKLNNSVVAHQAGYGVVLDGAFPVETTELTGNAFFDNAGYPLHLGKAVFVDSSNVFHDPAQPELKNTKQCIEVATDIDRVVVLATTELGFLFSGRHIRAEVLTPEGVIFKAQDAAIYQDAAGTFFNGLSAIFTSYKDDAVGGDCTGDGPTPPAVGDWQGLWIDDGTSSGYAAPADGIRFATSSGTMTLH